MTPKRLSRIVFSNVSFVICAHPVSWRNARINGLGGAVHPSARLSCRNCTIVKCSNSALSIAFELRFCTKRMQKYHQVEMPTFSGVLHLACFIVDQSPPLLEGHIGWIKDRESTIHPLNKTYGTYPSQDNSKMVKCLRQIKADRHGLD